MQDKSMYLVVATTESCDKYHFLFEYKPVFEEIFDKIVEFIWEWEGDCESLEWYKQTTAMYIQSFDMLVTKDRWEKL